VRFGEGSATVSGRSCWFLLLQGMTIVAATSSRLILAELNGGCSSINTLIIKKIHLGLS